MNYLHNQGHPKLLGEFVRVLSNKNFYWQKLCFRYIEAYQRLTFPVLFRPKPDKNFNFQAICMPEMAGFDSKFKILI